MNRIAQLDPAEVTGRTQQLFGAVQSHLGFVPNLVRVLGNSPAALDAYLKFSTALTNGLLGPKVREQVALAVAETNLCGYCLSAHATSAAKAGLSAQEIENARRASASADKTDAVLKLARGVVLCRGEISDADVQSARNSGLGDAEIVETVAQVALNIFTNYINHVAKTVIDFPEVQPGTPAPTPPVPSMRVEATAPTHRH